MKVNGVGIIPYMKWTIIQMFETTKQLMVDNGYRIWVS